MAELPTSVIVGYDGSPDAKRALTWGAGFARTVEAPLRVVVATGDMRLRQVTELDQEWERSRVAGGLPGAVRQPVAHHAPGAVVVVREQSSPEESRVVVGVDGSDNCKPAL